MLGLVNQVELLVPMVLRVQLDHELLVAEPNLLMVVKPGQEMSQVPLELQHLGLFVCFFYYFVFSFSSSSSSSPSLGSSSMLNSRGSISTTFSLCRTNQ